MKPTKNKKIKIVNKRSAVIWVILVLFAICNIYFAIQTSASGAIISQLEEEESRISQENKRLASELIELDSLKNLEKEAEDLGFAKPGKIIYITGDATVAKVP